MSGEKVVGLLFRQPARERVAAFICSTGMPCFVEAFDTAWGACFLEDGYLDRPPQRAAVSELSRVVPLLHFRHAEDFSWEYGIFDGGVEAAWMREDYELPYAVADELAAARGVDPSSFWEEHADEVLRSPEYGAAYRAQFARRNVAAFAAFGLEHSRIAALDALLAGDDPEDGFDHERATPVDSDANHQHDGKRLDELNRRGQKRRDQHGEAWQEQDLVFTTAVGGPIRGNHILQRHFAPLCERHGLPRIRLHDLRHTLATLLFKNRIPAKVVQEMLGHSTISMTLDTYSHVLPEMQAQAAESLDDLLGRDG